MLSNNNSNNNSNWIWGIFYYNKNDPRLFPPKRAPMMGWTINFANPRSVFAMLVLIFLVGVGVYLIKKN